MIQVPSEQSRNQLAYLHSATGVAAALCVDITNFFVCYMDTVCGFTTVYLDLFDHDNKYVRC